MKIKIKKKSLIKGWDLWKDGITQSFIHSFLTCREQTRLKYKELWTNKKSSLAIEFGSCYHWMLSKIYKNPDVLKNIDLLIKEYRKLWSVQNPVQGAKQCEQLELIFGIIKSMIPEYFERWNGDLSGKYKHGNSTVRPEKWIAFEHRFKISYQYSDGKSTYLTGALDGCFYDKKKNLWLFETKTKGMIDEEGIQDILPVDIQVMLYLYAMQTEYKKRPEGVLYNVIRRPGQRQLKDESLKSFLERIQKEVSNHKKYDHYFKRWELSITDKEMQDWKIEFLDPVMQEIRMWSEGKLPHYMNPDSLITKYGHSDMYGMILKNDIGDCYRRKFVFNELIEDV